MRIQRTQYAGDAPVFQIDSAMRSIVGGFVLDKSNVALGLKVSRGATLSFDEESGKAKVIKTAEVAENAGATATALKVKKGHLFAVGDTVKGKAISAIEVGDDFDTITLESAIGAVKAGEVVYDIATIPENLGLLYQGIEVHNGAVEITLINSGTVYEKRTYPIGADLGAKMPRMIRSKSY